MSAELITVDEAGRLLGVSRSTVWRLIQRGDLPSVRRAGRRLVPVRSLRTRTRHRPAARLAPFTDAHPIFGLAGAGRGGGRPPGARDKHALLDE